MLLADPAVLLYPTFVSQKIIFPILMTGASFGVARDFLRSLLLLSARYLLSVADDVLGGNSGRVEDVDEIGRGTDGETTELSRICHQSKAANQESKSG